MTGLVLNRENLVPEIFSSNPDGTDDLPNYSSRLEVTVTITPKPLALMQKSKKANPQTPHGAPGLGFKPCCEAFSS